MRPRQSVEPRGEQLGDGVRESVDRLRATDLLGQRPEEQRVAVASLCQRLGLRARERTAGVDAEHGHCGVDSQGLQGER